MSENINYDFDLCRDSVNKLENISNNIKAKVLCELISESDTVSKYWQSDEQVMLMKKIQILEKEINTVSSDIMLQAENIKKISKKLFLAEQKAKKLSANQGNEAT